MISRRTFCQALATLALGAQLPAPAKPSKLRILILGGTRFLGPALVEAARAKGHHLTLFNRGKTEPHMFKPGPDMELLTGDRDASLDALKGHKWDAVIDTSGYHPEQVERCLGVLKGNIGQYVFVSTISTYADQSKVGMTEDAPQRTGSDPQDYGAQKARCEEVLVKALGQRASLIRPCVMGGPRDATDRFTYWVLRMKWGNEVLAPGDGLDPTQLLDVRDAARFMVTCAESSYPGPYNLAPAPRLFKEFLEACRVDKGAQLTWVGEAFMAAHKLELPLWADRNGSQKGFFQISAQKAQARGLKLRPLTQSVADTRKWFDSLPPGTKTHLQAGLPPDMERTLLGNWHQEKG